MHSWPALGKYQSLMRHCNYTTTPPLIHSTLHRYLQERFQQQVNGAQDELRIWDGYLVSDPDHLVGSSLTLADLSLAMILFFAMRNGATLTAYQHLTMYADKMRQESVLQETWPPHWLNTPDKDWLSAVK